MKTILIVDDEFGIVEALTDILEEEHYHVVTAANGRDGLERLRTAKPDLLVLDLMMPVLSGRGMLDAMQKESALAHVPVILMSAVPRKIAFPLDRPRPAFVANLRKPFSLYTLLDAIATCLGPVAP